MGTRKWARAVASQGQARGTRTEGTLRASPTGRRPPHSHAPLNNLLICFSSVLLTDIFAMGKMLLCWDPFPVGNCHPQMSPLLIKYHNGSTTFEL